MSPQVDKPVHIAFVMDGNGRWATQRGLPRVVGHREGLKAVRAVVMAAQENSIPFITLYSFSTENWKRPRKEVEFLFSLMKQRLKKEAEELHAHQVRVKFIGDRLALPRSLQKIMGEVESLTAGNSGLTLTFAINYGGRQEIIQAVNKLLKEQKREKEITEEIFRRYFDSAFLPDPDIIVRTAGEMRLSNFLLWQSCYAEFYFTDKLWPDFNKDDFAAVLTEYRRRHRKFGGL
ncbi:MAG: polyprenyl diphosphate synthase [Candidatus Omnitrophica bacterium]|nr:polyprenyl diphosphate synthase [Candidatus Omnitrophota bacterium]